MKLGYNELGYNKHGYIKLGYNKLGYNKLGYNELLFIMNRQLKSIAVVSNHCSASRFQVFRGIFFSLFPSSFVFLVSALIYIINV